MKLIGRSGISKLYHFSIVKLRHIRVVGHPITIGNSSQCFCVVGIFQQCFLILIDGFSISKCIMKLLCFHNRAVILAINNRGHEHQDK